MILAKYFESDSTHDSNQDRLQVFGVELLKVIFNAKDEKFYALGIPLRISKFVEHVSLRDVTEETVGCG